MNSNVTLRELFYEAAPRLRNWLDQGHIACVNATKATKGVLINLSYRFYPPCSVYNLGNCFFRHAEQPQRYTDSEQGDIAGRLIEYTVSLSLGSSRATDPRVLSGLG